jgi:hypothetical protein
VLSKAYRALGPRAGQDQRLVAISVARGHANVDAVDGLIPGGDGIHVELLTAAG